MVGIGETEYLRGYIQYENDQFTHRINLFFLAESMLFVSYVTSLGLTANINKLLINNLPIILIVIGIITSVTFLAVLWRQVDNIYVVKKELEKIDPVSKTLKKLRGKQFGSTHVVLGQLLPASFLLVWTILFIFSVDNPCYIVLLLIFVIISIYGYQYYYLKIHPKLFPEEDDPNNDP